MGCLFSIGPATYQDSISHYKKWWYGFEPAKEVLVQRTITYCSTSSSGLVDVVALLDMKHHRKIHVDTEVWSWGSGDHGQLGHADLLDRSPFLDLQHFL